MIISIKGRREKGQGQIYRGEGIPVLCLEKKECGQEARIPGRENSRCKAQQQGRAQRLRGAAGVSMWREDVVRVEKPLRKT